jgi:diaminopimelate decarboxylase
MSGLTFAQHAPHPWFRVADDQLVIGGRSILELAELAGQTPFYVYDRSVMTRKIEELRKALPSQVHLHYAMKANPMPAVVGHMLGLVDGLDVASAGEMQVVLDAGAAPSLVSFAGPGKTDVELARAAAAGITINVESERELRVLGAIGARTGRRPRVAVRVNPDFELKSSGMKMGGGPKQFGIDAERVPEALATIGKMDLQFEGFHIFSGSQNLRPESISESQRKAVALAIRLAEHAPSPVRTLNIGGGFGIPYFPDERRLDLEPISSNLGELVPEVARALPGAQLVLELGRYLVGESGAYVCRIIDRKVSRGQVYLVCDGGLHHHLAASGNFGQVLRKNYPVVIGNRIQGTEREIASVVGPLCTPLDLLADRMDLARAEEGDLVAVLQSGAYGLSSSPRAFLSHPPAVELLV